MIGIYNTQQI